MGFLKKISGFKSWRKIAAIAHDAFVAYLAWIVAFVIRFNFDIPSLYVVSLQYVMVWAIPLQIFFFFQFGLYRGVWRFASLPDLKRILSAIFISTLVIGLVLLMVRPVAVVPRSVLLVNPLILILLLGGSRFFYRVWKDHRKYGHNRRQGKSVLLLGEGEHLIGLVKDLDRSSEWNVVGVLNNKQNLHGLHVEDVKILGPLNQLGALAKQYHVQDVIVAMPTTSQIQKRKTIELANSLGLRVLTVPSFDDIMSGKINVSQIRPVQVEDLLGRDEVSLDETELHKMIDEKTVLVSGAGGSIGSELCRQILNYKPHTLICLDLSEFSLYTIEQEFSQLKKPVRLIYLTGDVKNKQRMHRILDMYKPSVVFHAAAYKHVPLMENGNVHEAISNNVIGTHTIAKACQDLGVEKFVLVSTDKAVNPTNIMGASKRLAEMVCQGLQSVDERQSRLQATEFVIVRFGNVLGSSGSVIPKFKDQIAKGGPVTITHPDITRYFMSIAEASQLVMQAGSMGNGGEIFVLDMGEPVKITDLAKDMIRLSGFHHDEILIEFTGLRPGEKLYEELLADDETTLATEHKQLRIAQSRVVNTAWLAALLKWLESAQDLSEDQIKAEMKYWVEEYTMQKSVNLNEASLSQSDKHPTIH